MAGEHQGAEPHSLKPRSPCSAYCGTEGTGNFCAECGHALKRQGISPHLSARDRPWALIGKRLSNTLTEDAEAGFKASFVLAEEIRFWEKQEEVGAA